MDTAKLLESVKIARKIVSFQIENLEPAEVQIKLDGGYGASYVLGLADRLKAMAQREIDERSDTLKTLSEVDGYLCNIELQLKDETPAT